MGQRSVNRDLLSAQTLGASFTSDSINISEARSIWLQCIVTSASSLNGTLSIQASSTPTIETSWSQLGSLSGGVTANGVVNFDVQTTGAPFIRIKWVSTTGTGSLAASYSVKLEG